MNSITEKQCNKCMRWKPFSEFHANGKWGYRPECKECYRKISKERYKANPESFKERNRRYVDAHPEKVSARKRRWALANIEKVRQQGLSWIKNNIEKERERLRKYRESHRELLREKARLRTRNPEKEKQYYLKRAPGKSQEYKQNRRARVKGNGGSFTAQEWRELKKFYKYTCLRCKRQEPEIKLTPDHVLPLKLGGSSSIKNIQPLCESCNKKKNARYMDYR